MMIIRYAGLINSYVEIIYSYVGDTISYGADDKCFVELSSPNVGGD